MSTFDMTADIIDSREVIERLEELEALAQIVEEAREGGDQDEIDAAYADFGRVEDGELGALRIFADEASCVSDWEYGAIFVRDSYFVDYAREEAEECGYIPADLPPFIATNIDWSGVADDLKVDYTDYELDGVTYWARA